MPSATKERAGARNVLITWQAPGETVSAGVPTIPWTTQGTAWVSMKGLSGTNHAGLTATAVYQFETMYRADVTPRWRLLFGTRTFEILSVMDPTGLGEDLTLVAQEILA